MLKDKDVHQRSNADADSKPKLFHRTIGSRCRHCGGLNTAPTAALDGSPGMSRTMRLHITTSRIDSALQGSAKTDSCASPWARLVRCSHPGSGPSPGSQQDCASAIASGGVESLYASSERTKQIGEGRRRFCRSVPGDHARPRKN